MTDAALIGLDWGTSSFRAYLLDHAGNALARRTAEAGILTVTDGDFAAILMAQVGDWLADHAGIPILASGMIGSRQGWHEAPYVACPADAAGLAAAIARAPMSPDREVHFVPGVSIRTGAAPDVMRGEETQIVGAAVPSDGDQLFVLPGTHSKWVLVRHGVIIWFATFMTGELFTALRDHTILGRTMSGPAVGGAAFGRGVAAGADGAAAHGGLLRRLFGARTLALFDELSADKGPSFLSGLLIGAELREAMAMLPADAATIGPAIVVGRGDLAALYAEAMRQVGVETAAGVEDAAARGLWRIAAAAGLIGS